MTITAGVLSGRYIEAPQISNRDDDLGRGVDFRDSDENYTEHQAEQRVLHRAGLPETISLVNFGRDFALLSAFGPLRRAIAPSACFGQARLKTCWVMDE
jgi:hypothetical protein